MLADLVHKDEETLERRGSFFTSLGEAGPRSKPPWKRKSTMPRASFSLNQSGMKSYASEAPESENDVAFPDDPKFREWAMEELGLSPEQLEGVEATESFQMKMQHLMLCW